MLVLTVLAIAIVLAITMAAGHVRNARDRRRLDRMAVRLDQVMRGLARHEEPPPAH